MRTQEVLVHRLVRLLHASFRPRLATTPLRFAMTSPPSGCQGDFHPRAFEHAWHTTKKAGAARPRLQFQRISFRSVTDVRVEHLLPCPFCLLGSLESSRNERFQGYHLGIAALFRHIGSGQGHPQNLDFHGRVSNPRRIRAFDYQQNQIASRRWRSQTRNAKRGMDCRSLGRSVCQPETSYPSTVETW
jgi:hypothetical protein